MGFRDWPAGRPNLVADAIACLDRQRVAQGQVKALPQRPYSRWGILRDREAVKRSQINYAKDLARIAGQRLGIALDNVAVRFVPLEGRAGQVYQHLDTFYIDLSTSIVWDSERLASVIAHELSHIVTAGKYRAGGDSAYLELITDAVAALVGFGRIMAAARTRSLIIPLLIVAYERHSTVGYLDERILRKLAVVSDFLAQQRTFRIHTPIDSTKYRNLACRACWTRAALPKRDGDYRLRCRQCGLLHRITLQSSPNWISVFTGSLLDTATRPWGRVHI